MSMIAFLRRLTGTSHESARAQARFEHNIRSVEQQGRELDKLQADMVDIVDRVVSVQRKIRASTHPSSYSGEHQLALDSLPVGELHERRQERRAEEGVTDVEPKSDDLPFRKDG